MDTLFAEIAEKWERLDILVHSIAFAPREALAGRVTDCPRDRFPTAMEVSCWSLLNLVRRAEPLMHSGSAIFAMSYHGASEVIENYGIMGPVKAVLGSAMRYLAAELGPQEHPCARDQPWPARDPRGFGHPRFRYTDDPVGASNSAGEPWRNSVIGSSMVGCTRHARAAVQS